MTKTEMLEIAKPILFNTEMVSAILDGRKTTTRRKIKYEHCQDHSKTLDDFIGDSDPQMLVGLAPYKLGDYLYVRETWLLDGYLIGSNRYGYKADGVPSFCYWGKDGYDNDKWHPSIHMPKEAARIFLKVTGVRVERLQDITTMGMKNEGLVTVCYGCYHQNGECTDWQTARECTLQSNFIELWDSTIKKADIAQYGWNANPWVWVIEFERVMIDG